ncbi:membrane glycoprotein 2 [Mactra antiquata]
MEIVKILMITGVCSVYGVRFEFGDKSEDPCILLDIDAEFNLEYHDVAKNTTEIAPKFDLQGAEVVNKSSICGDRQFDTVLTVRIFPTREELKFKFEKENKNQISMSLTLSLKPAAHFSDLNGSLPLDMQDSKNLPAGSYSNDSYKCASEQLMIFDQYQPYTMVAKIKNFQVQAYNVENGNYGPVNECPLDHTSTTEAHTTEPVTTVPPETTITTQPHSETTMTTQPHSETTMTTQPHSETTMTTQPHSETTMTTRLPITTQPATINNYVVSQGNEVCIVLRGKMSVEIPYMTKDNKAAKVNVSIPKETTASGTCKYNDSDSAQEIKLSFYDGWDLTFVIVKGGKSGYMLDDSDDNDFSWQEISLTYVVDEQFPNARNPGENNTVVQIDTFGQFKANLDGSYKCNTKQSIQLQTNIKLDVSDLQYRAFGTSSDPGFSSDNVSECAADKKDDSNDRTLAIILGAGFGGLAVLIILAGVVYRCKQKKYRGPYDEI